MPFSCFSHWCKSEEAMLKVTDQDQQHLGSARDDVGLLLFQAKLQIRRHKAQGPHRTALTAPLRTAFSTPRQANRRCRFAALRTQVSVTGLHKAPQHPKGEESRQSANEKSRHLGARMQLMHVLAMVFHEEEEREILSCGLCRLFDVLRTLFRARGRQWVRRELWSLCVERLDCRTVLS